MAITDYFANIISLIPAGYYKLDEDRGTIAFDFSIFARHLIIFGGPTLKVKSLCSDWPNGAMHFNAGSDYLQNVFSPNPFATSAALTIVGLLKPDTIAQSGNIVRSGLTNSSTDWQLSQFNDKLRYSYYNGSLINVDSSSVLTTSRSHFALTRAADGKTVKFYVNGLLVNTVVAASAPAATPTALTIGGNVSALDEIAIFPGNEMPSWQIAQLSDLAVRIWPASPMPQVFDQPQYEESLLDLTSRFPTIYGPPKTRPHASASYTNARGMIQIRDSDKDTLETFYTDTLKGGALSFEAMLRGESSSVIYRFLNPPVFHDLEGGEFEASLDLLALP